MLVLVWVFVLGILGRSVPAVFAVFNTDNGECRAALGMEEGRIPDHAISASSSYEAKSVGPQNASVQDMSIYIGSNYLNKGKLYKPTRKLEHPKFVLKTLQHNLALLRLAEGLKWSPSVKYIILDTELTSRRTFAVTVGWGKTSQSSRGPSEQLQAALLTTTECPDRYNIPGYVCSDKSLGAGLCAGDQGNALYDYVTSRLIGVSSISSGCGTKGRNSPDVYTSVAEYYYWITETANANYN